MANPANTNSYPTAPVSPQLADAIQHPRRLQHSRQRRTFWYPMGELSTTRLGCTSLPPPTLLPERVWAIEGNSRTPSNQTLWEDIGDQHKRVSRTPKVRCKGRKGNEWSAGWLTLWNVESEIRRCGEDKASRLGCEMETRSRRATNSDFEYL